MQPNPLLDIAGAIVIVGVIVQVTKFLLTAHVSASAQNNVVRLYVFGLSTALIVGVGYANHTLGSAQGVLSALAAAFAVATGSIANYHLLNDALSSPPTSVTPPVTTITSTAPVRAGKVTVPVTPTVVGVPKE